eukprot:TRINITY_DN85064_c0_g1_i1.p1 TRINITY_DN85064_c0_g1~~TRINITY_DN85064_c0_g1_i1.p1  ORF type:complete len:273 (+),score=22.56 TRINITY_DN85064_c0_g1_i1:65-820(+)
MPAPVVVRHGHTVIHVNDPNMLKEVFAALPLPVLGPASSMHASGTASVQKEPPLDVVAHVASAASALQDQMSSMSGRHHRSLHCAMKEFRQQLSPSSVKQIKHLNSAYAFLRHTTACSLRELVDSVQKEMHSAVDSFDKQAHITSTNPSSSLAGHIDDPAAIGESTTHVTKEMKTSCVVGVPIGVQTDTTGEMISQLKDHCLKLMELNNEGNRRAAEYASQLEAARSALGLVQQRISNIETKQRAHQRRLT